MTYYIGLVHKETDSAFSFRIFRAVFPPPTIWTMW